jgi:hypothetical protein
MKICELNPFKLVYSYILMLLLSVFVVRGKESNGLVLCYIVVHLVIKKVGAYFTN